MGLLFPPRWWPGRKSPAGRRPAGPPPRRSDPDLGRPPWAPDRRWLLAAAGAALFHLSHPLAWGVAAPALWFAPAGIGLGLLAWCGPAVGFLLAADGVLVGFQAWAAGTWGPPGQAGHFLLAHSADALLTALELYAAWWLYFRFGKGLGALSDPRSAALFLLAVPGTAAGLFVASRLALMTLTGWPLLPCPEPPGVALAAGWVDRALGTLALAPFLFVTVTPLLLRWGLVASEWQRRRPDRALTAHRLGFGEWVEITGLALGTGVAGVVLAVAYGRGDLTSWQLWGLPLLFIVWASLRQGVQGAMTVATTAAAFCLAVDPWVGAAGWGVSPLQGNLLAQCMTALLVGGSISWIRANEARYRQVVGHIPVVLYSARLLAAPPGGRPRAEGKRAPALPAGLGFLPPGSPPVEITFVSPACRNLMGRPPEDLQGAYGHWLQSVHPQDRELIGAALAQMKLDHRPVVCEYRLKGASPPAAERWVRDTLVPHFSPDGELEGWEGVVEDITEQRALASDLRRTTGMFHALVSNLPAGVFFVQGPGGQPILINARARQLLGQREAAVTGLEHLPLVYRLFRPDGTPYPADELPVARALRQGVTSMREDIIVHRPDGRRIPLVSWAAPIDLGGRGQSDAAVWVLEDLTTLHQAEAARLESEARLRAVIGTMAEGLIVQDRAGRILDHNPAACAILGLGPDQLQGRAFPTPDLGCLREDGSPFPEAEYPAPVSLRTGQPVRGVVMGLPRPAADGGPEVRWILMNAMPLPAAEDGDKSGRVVTTFADVTARRQALEVLRASEEKYRGLVETLPVMLVQFDREGRPLYLNPATQATTGYTLAELQEPGAGRRAVHGEDLARATAAWHEARAGHTGRAEVRYRARDGGERVAYAVFHPWRQDGRAVGVTVLALDMTLQRHLERELQRAQRLEQVGRMASGVVHDFNNLLTVVMTLADLAQSHLPEGHPVRDDLRRISEAGEHAARLAGQLQRFSRQRPGTARRVDLNRVTSQTLALLRRTLPATIAIDASLTRDELPVEADEVQLQQILLNLCLNARDAMPQGGRLAVRTSEEGGPGPAGEGLAAPPAGWVRLSVEDTGHGMEEGVRARIFDPFFSTKEGGTGLGLAVVKQIIENAGGRVEVGSQPGRGTRFDLWLPRAGAAEAEAAAAAGNGVPVGVSTEAV